MNSKKLNTLLAGAVSVAALGTLVSASPAQAEGKEKCYGVVKAGKNGCASADKAHGCAGQATADASGAEWIVLPEGLCEKLAGGSLEPVLEPVLGHDDEHSTEEHDSGAHEGHAEE